MLRTTFLSILKQYCLRAALGGENVKKLTRFKIFKNTLSEPSLLEHI